MKKLLAFLSLIVIIVIIFYNANAQSTGTKIRGVVMGISKYMNVPSLQYADRDAMSFYQYLLSPAGGKADTNNIRLLLNEKATSYNFFEAMDNLLDAAKEGDVVYIYFAGHGDIEKKTERQNGFLIGYNAPPNCYAAGGSIGVRYLQDYVETLISKNKSKVILIIDACRSGKLAGGREGAEITALALKQEWKGVTKILSCQPGEHSLEGDNWGGGAGVFTYFMLKGLKGLADKDNDNEVSLLELSHFLDENVPKETENKQLPEVVGDKRQDIAKVDKETYHALLNKPEGETKLPENINSAGFETDLSSINDVSILKAYERFKDYIKTENLIAYNDEEIKKETALSIYRSLEGNREANPIIISMKRELLSALQNKSQIIFNDWLNNIYNTDSIALIKTQKEIKTAINIIDSSYYQYEQIRFKYLLWSSIIETDTSSERILLEECMRINPNDPIVNYDLGVLYSSQNNNEEAYYYYDKTTELSKNWSPAWHNKGIALISLKRYEEAIKCFDKVIEIRPEGYYGWYLKGNIYSLKKNYEESIQCYDKAIERYPKFVRAWYNKACAFSLLENKEEMLKSLKKSIELNSKNKQEAKKDNDFKEYWDDPDFKKLVE
ncbi:MAG: tetratricopeptide repeat protein [Bacteroidetes bacterium]|nr:MAG: tetratricopeptide repeat protein [Bacteroidota bacterium]